jgi:hypothetical protein
MVIGGENYIRNCARRNLTANLRARMAVHGSPPNLEPARWPLGERHLPVARAPGEPWGGVGRGPEQGALPVPKCTLGVHVVESPRQ